MPAKNSSKVADKNLAQAKLAPNTTFPFFSIIVPAYNVAEFLPQCIESVISQDFQDFEIILVDDGSTDETGKICDNYAKKLPYSSIISQKTKKVNGKVKTPYIKVIHQANAGLSEARNSGVAQASGQYLIFLDGDDFLEPDSLGKIATNLQDQPDLLRFQVQDVFGDGKIVPHPESGFSTMPGVQAFLRLASYYYTENAWCYAYRSKFFKSHNFRYAKGRLSEDFGLTPLVIASAHSVKSISDICYNYRQRVGSIMHNPAKEARRISDSLAQLEALQPKLSVIPGSEPILRYLVVSLASAATKLSYSEFQKIYQQLKHNHLLIYARPNSLKSIPRTLTLRLSPQLFYRIYHP